MKCRQNEIRGAGLGLRFSHIPDILQSAPPVKWWEVVSENYFRCGEKNLVDLERVRELAPFVFHGVGLNLGAAEPLSTAYLEHLQQLIERFEPTWVSDHLCWTGLNGFSTHDLLPLPLHPKTVDHLVTKIAVAQEFLGCRLVLENASTYVRTPYDEMSEGEFLEEVSQRADCELLLDVNNLYVNSVNFGFDPKAELGKISRARVRQLHVAGHENWGGFLVDTHSGPASSEVQELLIQVYQQMGPVPTLLEWDRDLPPLDSLLNTYEELQNFFVRETEPNGPIQISEPMA